MIHVQDLRFAYRDSDFRLHVPELSVGRGQATALIGPSGSGKTTLLDLIAGCRVPDAGSIDVAGQPVAVMSDGRRRDFRIRNVGMVFQEFELIDYLNVIDNILLPYRISPALRLDANVRRRAARLAGEVGLAGKLTRNVRRLSQGERQRVAVCRALVTEPPLLLCDEPTGNLDPANKEHLLHILFGRVVRGGQTMLVVTHDHELLPRFQRVIDCQEFVA